MKWDEAGCGRVLVSSRVYALKSKVESPAVWLKPERRIVTCIEIDGVDSLRQWLVDRGIDLSLWGTGGTKTVEALWTEIAAVETILQDAPPLRILRVTEILIEHDGKVLYEVEQALRDGRRRRRNHPPTEKICGRESVEETVYRCLSEELGVSPSQVDGLIVAQTPTITEGASPSYPGLRTRYLLYPVTVAMVGLPNSEFWTEESAANQSDLVVRHRWAWVEAA